MRGRKRKRRELCTTHRHSRWRITWKFHLTGFSFSGSRREEKSYGGNHWKLGHCRAIRRCWRLLCSTLNACIFRRDEQRHVVVTYRHTASQWEKLRAFTIHYHFLSRAMRRQMRSFSLVVQRPTFMCVHACVTVTAAKQRPRIYLGDIFTKMSRFKRDITRAFPILLRYLVKFIFFSLIFIQWKIYIYIVQELLLFEKNIYFDYFH